jgi:hypothetical protein
MDIWGDENAQIDDNYYDSEINDGEYNEDSDGMQQEFKTTFEQEQSALSEQNIARSCGTPIPFNIKPGTKEYVQAISDKTPLERFKLEVDYLSKILNNSSFKIFLSVDDRDTMCEKADNSIAIGIKPENLNSLAYVLGYISNTTDSIISDDDNIKNIKIKVEKMSKLIGNPKDDFYNLKNINLEASKSRSGNNFSVYAADVIRYGRMWKRLM